MDGWLLTFAQKIIMHTNIVTIAIAFLVFTLNIRAEEKFTVDLDKPIGIEYTLSDGDTTVISIKGWTVGKKDDEEDLIGLINSKDSGYHSHLIYRLNKKDMEDGLTSLDVAKHYYESLVEGTKILTELKWDQKQLKGVDVVRRVAKVEEDLNGDGKVEKLWLLVEAKEFKDRFYVQVVYHADPVSKKKLNLIGKVMNSVTIKKSKQVAAPDS